MVCITVERFEWNNVLAQCLKLLPVHDANTKLVC